MGGYVVTLNGNEIGDPEAMPIVGISVEQSVRLPDVFTIEILDPGFGLLDTDHYQAPKTWRLSPPVRSRRSPTTASTSSSKASTRRTVCTEARGQRPTSR
jgi:hypothetical protein